VSDPLVPVTRSMKAPTEALGPAVIVSGEDAIPPVDGVMGDGSAKLTSVGAVPTQEATNITADENPLREVIVTVAELLLP